MNGKHKKKTCISFTLFPVISNISSDNCNVNYKTQVGNKLYTKGLKGERYLKDLTDNV